MPDHKPLVDVIIASYNADAFLVKRAIKSVIAQSFTDWNLHIINDGGPLDFRDVLDGIMDPRVFVYNRQHQGKAAALNFGLSVCSGRLLAYLDDDDFWFPNHLEVAVTFLQKNNLQFVYTDALAILLEKRDNFWEPVYKSILHHGVISDKTFNHVGQITVIHDRSLIDLGGAFDEERLFYIDWDFFLRVVKYCKPVHIPVVTCMHYYYMDETGDLLNPISRLHKKNSELSKEAARNLYRRAFDYVNADDFVELAQAFVDTVSLNSELKWEIAKLKSGNAEQESFCTTVNTDNCFIKRPSRIDFPYDESQQGFHGGWQTQSPDENFRWVNKKASVELSVPSNAKKLCFAGYLPPFFYEVTKARVCINEIPFSPIEVECGEPFILEQDLPEGLGADFIIDAGIEFDGVHYSLDDSEDKRDLSAVIESIFFI